MKIAFYIAKHGDWTDKVISYFTISKYSHCELIFSNGEFGSSSARDGGVRVKFISQDYKWDIFDLKNPDGTEISQEHEKMIRSWFSMHEKEPYDWPGAIMSLFSVNWTSDDKKFCSYVCASLLGMDPIVSPQKLFKNLSEEKMIEPYQNLMMEIK